MQYICICIYFWLTAVGNIDTSGISMLEEMKKAVDRKGLKVHSSSVIFLCKLLVCILSPNIYICGLRMSSGSVGTSFFVSRKSCHVSNLRNIACLNEKKIKPKTKNKIISFTLLFSYLRLLSVLAFSFCMVSISLHWPTLEAR